ncbi:MAG TPA: efflux RND transporter permease subunit [Rhabdaerophilum sp.]|nr:efflux RND transporter permease subunit [Rhabdaerophilum sp.]
MQLSDVSIRRPVFASVISLLLCVAGIAGLMGLPVREYPQIDPPIVSVNTAYKGASNEVIESRVTEVIERAVAGIEGITNISSFSQNDRSSISIEFDVNRDPDAAAADVRDRVGRVLARLPDGVDAPVIQRVDSNAQAILWIGVTSTKLDALELTDLLRRTMVDRLATVPGVASVNIGGERRYAMRIAINRTALAARRLTVQDVETAIKRQNVDLPGGRLTSSQRELTVKTDSKLSTREEFANIVVWNGNGYQVRLGEIANVEVGAEDERFEFFASGKTAIGLGIIRQSTANTLSVAENVAAELNLLRASLPEGTTAEILYNEARFIRASIDGVLKTLAEGIGLVILVILVFLRSWRSTLVAGIAIPVSIIPTFAVLWMFGFSINVLTLLAIVLAIGIVVDDAIVEVENIVRRIEDGEPPLLASFIGAREIAFAVIATTITLISVFVPIAFMSGQTGRLFREFGVTLATAIFFSGVVARTLTPMMCSKLLSSHHGRIHHLTEPLFEAMNRIYARVLKRALAAPLIVIAVGAAISFGAVQLFKLVPKEFSPVEDRGIIIVPVTAPESASLAYTRARVREVEALLKPYFDNGTVESSLTIVAPGFQRPAPVNAGLVIVRLTPWGQRKVSQQQLQRELLGRVQQVPGARVFPINPPSLGQRGFRQPIEFVIGGPDFATLAAWRDIVMEKATATGLFLNLDSDYTERQPDLRVKIDRARAADLGVSIEAVGRSLELMFGEREVSTFVDRGIEYSVIMQAREQDRVRPDDLKNVFVRTASGDLVPLSNLVSLSEMAGPQKLNRFDRLRSIKISGSLASGVTLGQALDTLDAIARDNLPAEARIGYDGQSKEYRKASSSLYLTFGFALLVVFLVLAAQFESWIAPAVIMITVPLALTGALAILLATNQTLNVYSQIGMILLIGIMTKNGILIVEFTNQLRERGVALYDAILEASEMRLRPILMTSIATICGAVPLATSSGAGAEARSAIGWVIIGGASLSTLMTLFLVPVVFLLAGRFTNPRSTIGDLLDEMQERFKPAGKDEDRGARGEGMPAE